MGTGIELKRSWLILNDIQYTTDQLSAGQFL